MSIPLGHYILSFKWWNVKFDFFTYKDDWYMTIRAALPGKLKEPYVSISNRGVIMRRFD